MDATVQMGAGTQDAAQEKRTLLWYPFPSQQTTGNLGQTSGVGGRYYDPVAALRHGGPGRVELLPANLKEIEMGTMLTDSIVAWRLKHIAARLPPDVENKIFILSSFMSKKWDDVILLKFLFPSWRIADFVV